MSEQIGGNSCDRCGIRHPLVLDVVNGDLRSLCANCKLLKDGYPDDFRREPTYGPISATGWPYTVKLNYVVE